MILNNFLERVLPRRFFQFYFTCITRLQTRYYILTGCFLPTGYYLPEDFWDPWPEILKEKKKSEFSTLIKKIFPKCKELAEIFFYLYELRESKSKNFLSEYTSILGEISFLHCSSYSYKQWQFLKTISAALCLYKLSYICRQKAIENSITNKKNDIPYFLALMEQEDYKSAWKVIKRMTLINANIKKILSSYYSLLVNKKPLEEKKDKYYEFIEDKDVYVMGPVFNEQASVPNNYITVRINYSLNKSIGMPNISYYNGGDGIKVVETGIINKLPQMYFCFKESKVITEINNRRAKKIDKLNRKYIFDLINMIYLNQDGSIKIEYKKK